ncbi:MAG: hypothetical protein IID45_05250 [Planctomycetes bacterium]|nr:hypothetical protein [Planctomycetota bacterium]
MESRKLPKNAPWRAAGISLPVRTRKLTLPGSPLGRRTPKLIASVIDSGCGFTLDCDDRFLCNGGVVCLFPDQITLDPYLLLGILNSKTFWMFIRHHSPTMGRGQYVYRAAMLKTVPLPVSDLNDDHAEITELAKQIMNDPLGSHKRRNLLSEIDKLVATLYAVMSQND